MSDKNEHYVRPDGGYGWFIVLSIFTCFVCVSGIQKANGLYFVYLMDTFQASNTTISAVTFVQKISEILTALIWSILAERYGSRILVFAGAILVIAGFILAAFSKTVIFITLSYGIICGMAFPMIVFPALQMLPRYFEKRLVLASALIFCGQSVGCITVPYIVSKCVSFYGVNGSFIIVAALHLHIFIAAALLRPFEPSDLKVVRSTEVAGPSRTVMPAIKEEPNTESVNMPPPYRSISHVVPSAVSFTTPVPKRSESTDASSRYRRPSLTPEPAAFIKWRKQRTLSSTISQALSETDETPSTRYISVACLSLGAPSPAPPIAPTTPHVLETEMSIVQERSDLNVFQVVIQKYMVLVRNNLCLLLGFSTFLHSFSMSIWGTFQQAYVCDVGFGDDFKQMLLILVSSFAELATRLLFGFIISKNWLKSYQWNQLACVLMATAMFSYPFVSSYVVIVVYNCFVGAVFSIAIVTIMPNLSEFLGIDMAPIGQGLMVIPNGLGMVSVQIGGTLRDVTGSFKPAFFMAASALLVSAVNFQFLNFLSVRRRKLLEKKESLPLNGNLPRVSKSRSTRSAKEDRAFTDRVIESLQNGHMESSKNATV